MATTKVTLTETDLVGLTLQEAKTLIFKSGYRFKVIREGSMNHPIPTDSRTDRFLISTSSGIVVEGIIG